MANHSWLIKFGVGGVQASIAQSRRLRDLAEGSAAVVEVVRAAAQAASHAKATIVTPFGADQDAPCGNHVVVQLRGVDEHNVRNTAQAIEHAARTAWRRMADAVLTDRHLPDAEQLRAARAQYDECLATWWVATPIQGDHDAHWAEAHDRLSRLAVERRWTRTFRQLTRFDNTAATCLQCGTRPSVFDHTHPILRDSLSDGERLCAVCASRRAASFGRFTKSFPDTNTIAAASPINNAEPRNASTPYYAIVVFDGDNIGEWFSGMRGRLGSPSLMEWQARLSRAIATFATKLQEDIIFPPAQLVYTGGDDGLALASIDHILPFVSTVRSCWESCMTALRASRSDEPLPTLSLHTSIVHVKEPLQAAMKRIHQELEFAKDVAGRDCFSLLVDPRGGAPSRLIAKWKELEHIEATLSWLRRAKSARIGYTLLERSRLFFDTPRLADGGLHFGLTDAWARELDLCASKSTGIGAASEWEAMRAWLLSRGAPDFFVEHDGTNPPTPWEHFSGGLEVLLFLARQLRVIDDAARGSDK